MTSLSFRRVLTAVFGALLALMPATTGFAETDSLLHFSVDVDQTQTLGLCGFPIVRRDVGTLQFVVAGAHDGAIAQFACALA